MRAVLLTLFGALVVSMAMAMPKVHKHANGHDAVVLSPSGHASLPTASPDVKVTTDDHADVITDTIGTCTKTGPCSQSTVGTTPAATIQVGTPPRDLLVIFDTGSDELVAKTALTIKTELASLEGGNPNLPIEFTDKIYDHDNSSTYYVMTMVDTKTNKTGLVQSTITYGSGEAVCLEGADSVRVGGRTFPNFTLLEISTDTLGLLHTPKALGGVLGLQHMKNKSLGRSLFSRFREADLLNSFGYCRGTGNNGTFIWADDSSEGTEMKVIGQMHWAVTLGTVMVHWPENGDSTHVAKDADKADDKETPKEAPKSPLDAAKDKVVEKYGGDKKMHKDSPSPPPSFISKNIDIGDDTSFITKISDYFLGSTAVREAREAMVTLQNTCPDNKCTGILDTGSNIIAGPTKAIEALNKLVDVSPNCSNVDSLPVVKFTLGGMEVTTEPSSYVMRVTKEEQKVFLEDTAGGSLEEKASRARSSANRQWIEAFDRLYRDHAVDLRDTVDKMLKQHDVTGLEDMCMSAFVAIDKQTEFGPLWVIGTPLMDTYYTRWSFLKDAESPTVHMKPLKDAKVCQEGGTQVLAKDTTAPAKDTHVLVRKEPTGLLRKEVKAKPSPLPKRVPITRKIEDISFPHWAKDLKHV